MPQIPEAAPQAAEVTDRSVGPTVSPNAFNIVGEAAERAVDTLGTKLLQMQDAQDVVKGTMDIEDHLNKVQEGILHSGDYKGYGNTLDDAVGQLNDAIQANYSGSVKTELLNRLAAQKINRSHQLDGWAYDQQVAAGQQTMQDHATQSLKNIAYGTPVERDMYKTAFLQDVDAHVGTLYTAAQATELKRQFGQQADYGSAITDLEKDPRMAAITLKDPKMYSEITPEQRATLQNEAMRRGKENQVIAEAGLRGQMDDALAKGAVTGQIDPTISARVASTGDKDLISEWNDSVNATRLYHDTAMKMMSANINDIPGIIQSFSPGGLDQMTGKPIAGKPNYGLNAIKSFGVQQKLYMQLQQLGTQLQIAADKDPASLTWGDSSKGLDMGHQMAEIIDRNNKLLTDRGIAVRDPLPDNVATSIATNISRADAQQRPALLQMLEVNAGPHFDEVIRQIASKIPPSTAFYNSVTPDTMKSLIANDAMTMPKMIEALGPKDNGVFTSIDTAARKQFETVSATLGNNPQQTSAIFETFEKLAISNQMSGIADPVGSAYKSLFTDAYAFDGSWRFPKGADASRIKDYAQQKLEDTSTFATEDGEPSDMARARFQSTGSWVYHDGPTVNGRASPGTYWLRDADGQQVYTQDGNPVQFSIASAMLWNKPDVNINATPGQLQMVERAH